MLALELIFGAAVAASAIFLLFLWMLGLLAVVVPVLWLVGKLPAVEALPERLEAWSLKVERWAARQRERQAAEGAGVQALVVSGVGFVLFLVFLFGWEGC